MTAGYNSSFSVSLTDRSQRPGQGWWRSRAFAYHQQLAGGKVVGEPLYNIMLIARGDIKYRIYA